MAESGNRPAVRISQKRLTIVVAVLAMLGTLTLGLAWWDSLEYFTGHSTHKRSIYIFWSSVNYRSESMMGDNPYVRGIPETAFHPPLFPRPMLASENISIPIYLLILAYLSSLLLIWIVLMNHLARRHFEKTRALPTQD